MSDVPRLLIIEDDEPLRERLEEVMRRPRAEWFSGPPLQGFRVNTAGTVEAAVDLLTKDQGSDEPYEVVLLDLRLPANDEEAKKDRVFEANGRRLLTHIKSTCKAAVVILTAYDSSENLIHALREAAADFLVKPINRNMEGVLFSRLVNAVGKTRESVHREMRTERLLGFKEHDRRRDVEEFAELISSKVKVITEQLHSLDKLLSRRFGLDVHSDPSDAIYQNFSLMENASREVLQSLWSLSDREPARYETVDIARCVRDQIARARPCYLYRGGSCVGAPPAELVLETKTFAEDVTLIVAELVFGSLELSPDGRNVELSLVLDETKEGDDILLSATREGEDVPRDLQEALGEGRWTRKGVEAKWQGLYFMQRLSNNIGARVEIDSGEGKTMVKLRIPVVGK